MSYKPHPDEEGKRRSQTKKWIIDYWETPPRKGQKGKRIRRVFKSESEEEVKRIELACRRMPYRPTPVNPRIADILPEYFSYVRLHRSERYAQGIEDCFKRLTPFFGNTQLSKITPQMINEYKKVRPRPQRSDKHTGVRAINMELIYFSVFYNWAVKQGYAHPLLFKIEKLPYRPKSHQIVYPSEIDKLLSKIKDEKGEKGNIKKALILFLYECGLRWKEASNIRIENSNIQEGIVYLQDTKGGTPRLCLLTDRIKQLLDNLNIKETGEGKEGGEGKAGWLFLNPHTNKPYRSIKTLLTLASKRAGIKRITPHQLRHSV